jgi:LemA protein
MIIFAVKGTENRAIGLEENVQTTQSDIDVQIDRRFNVLTELAECVKQYDKHEYETLKDVIDSRGKNMSATQADEVMAEINAVAEAYPELKSNENYKQLMNELSITENMIAQYRENYNKSVNEYNRSVKKFPTRMFLNMTGYEVVDFARLDYQAPVDAPQSLFED